MSTESWTITDNGSITLGRTTYTAETQTFESGRSQTMLTGPRGAVYFLREFLGEDTGLRQVISFKSGQPLRVRGNEVRVYHIGDQIEVAA